MSLSMSMCMLWEGYVTVEYAWSRETHGAARLARDIRHAVVRDDLARQARRPYGLGVPPDPRAELGESLPAW